MTTDDESGASAAPMENNAASAKAVDKGRQERQRSAIGFPYNALPEAGELAEKIHQHVGVGECSDAQLAAWLGMSAKASTFRVRVSSARTFGIIEAGSNEAHRLTDLGKRFVDPNRNREAKVDAFLAVPLYKAVFDGFEGGIVPPAAALERQIALFGVADKQKSRARAALEKSAEYAGFYEHGRNRLVKPGAHSGTGEDLPPPPPPPGGGGGGDGTGVMDHDPMIVGLFKRVPKVDQAWEIEDRLEWLQTAAQLFKFIYGSHEEGRVSVKIEKTAD